MTYQHFPAIVSRLWVAGLTALVCCVGYAQVLPAERVGVSGKELTAIKLPTDFNVSNGRILRMREVTIAPGGTLPMHSHSDRPSVSYVLKGTLTEHVEGSTESRQLAAGQAYASQGPKGHALQNLGDTPAVFLEVDLP